MSRLIPASAFALRVFLGVLPFVALPALAQAPADDGTCGGVVAFGETSPVRLMQVKSPLARVHFYESRAKARAHCPAEVDTCQRKGFVVPGDTVLAGPPRGNFACVSYIAPGAKRVKDQFPETAGFLPLSALVERPAATPALDDWFGTWTRPAEGEIDITRSPDGKLKIMGSATFGALDPRRVKVGAVNMGELDGVAQPKGNMVALGEGYDGTKPFGDDRSECRAKLRLFGRYLVVEDNGGCGGMNVSFTGVYIRLK